MQDEAEITINGAKLTDVESMTVRVAIDTLANVLAEGLGLETDGIALTDRYMVSLSRIQDLLESRESRSNNN
jgi:predicted RecB family endonuclease